MSDAISTYTFRALKEAMKYLSPRTTALLRGRHGIGKSAVAYQMAEVWGLDTVIERRISQLSEGDMIGLPDRGAVKHYDGKDWLVTNFLPTDWFLEAQHKPCLVFLDEINRGTPETMQACFQFVEKGELNGRKVHPDTRIIAAINDSKEYQVGAMDPAFIDRFWVADVEPDKEDWVTWAREAGIHSDVIDFIMQCNEDHFEIKPEKAAQLPPSEVTPSRRSWERFARHITHKVNGVALIDNPNSGVFYDLGRGFVGPDAARAFQKFRTERARTVTPEDVIVNFDSNEHRIRRMTPEQMVELIAKIKDYVKTQSVELTDENGSNLQKFMKVCPAEISVTLWSAFAAGSSHNASIFHKHTARHFIATLAETKIGKQLPNLKEILKQPESK